MKRQLREAELLSVRALCARVRNSRRTGAGVRGQDVREEVRAAKGLTRERTCAAKGLTCAQE